MRGKPVLATYGRWDKGELQTEAFSLDPIRFPIGKKLLQVISWNQSTKQMVLDIDPAQVTAILGYAYGSYPADITKFLFATIYVQSNQTDLKKFRKVTAVGISSGSLLLTLDQGFADPVTTSALVVIYLSNIQIVVDEGAVVGLRAANYLVQGSADGQTLPLELYGKESDILKAVPDRMFKVVADGKENQFTVETANISLEDTGEMIVADTVPLSILPPDDIHQAIDRTHVNGYKYFDFGFSPKGVDSNEITIKPASILFHWPPNQPGKGESIIAMRSVSGALYAMYSNTFTTLLWTEYPGATGYRITRFLVFDPQRRLGGPVAKTDIDPTFGASSSCILADGSVASASGGVVTLGLQSLGNVLIDNAVSTTETRDYEYRIEPLISGSPNPSVNLTSNRGGNRALPSGTAAIVALPCNGAILLGWAVPNLQSGFSVFQDGGVITGMPVTSATRGWYLISGLTNNQEYKFKVSINCLAIGTAGDVWFYLANVYTSQGVHHLLKSGGDYSNLPFSSILDSVNCDLENRADLGYSRSWGVAVKKLTNDGVDLPPAAVVFSWLWKVDQKQFGDMNGAKDVRVLADFVVRSWVGDNTAAHSTLTPFIIQLRGIKADKSVAFTIQYEDMTAKAPTETGAYGAYAQFKNLHGAKNGAGVDTNYDTDISSPNVNGLYTGKDLWKLPDYLFEDGAAEWNQIEYLMFSVTNAANIPYASVNSTSGKYHLGLGGPPNKNWAQVKDHKPFLYIEYTRKVDGGLSQPLYGRIDGGRVDDASGTITGTPGKIIETARHVIDHVVYSMLGFKPIRIGNEMKNRDGWIWRWQTKETKPVLDTLQILANNIHGIFTLTPDDKLYLRSLDIDNPNNPPVYTFTDSNILFDSLGKPEYRLRNEIYQKFRLKYNIEPSVGGPTEEMLIGWDLASSSPILSGYVNTVEDANGAAQNSGGDDGLADPLCRLSTQLFSAGLGINEFGEALTNERIYEMFYRPTKLSSLDGKPVERALPNLTTLWGVGVKPPKRAMQELAAMVVKFFCYDSWYFPLSCSMKNVIYNPDVAGFKDEAGTPDHKIKIGDVVLVNSSFHTAGGPVRAIVLGIELQSLYDGYATLHAFCPRPPGYTGTDVDHIWDAGGPGARNEANYLFKGSLYGLGNEAGTFADAGGPGVRNEANMKFPDGTFADPKGSGSGKA